VLINCRISGGTGREQARQRCGGDFMVKDLIRYDLLVQDALKGVVRKVLTDAARHGLPGEHHFYVSFLTGHPGVHLSNRLREKYPHEMTIVVQHQFWDLHVGENAFEIGLSFSNVPERLHVPFDALTGFFDPSVQFGLKFNSDEDGEEETASEPIPLENEFTRKLQEEKERKLQKPDQETISTVEEPASAEEKPPETKKPKKSSKKAGEEKNKEHGGAEVVSLDAFRKK